MRAAVQQKDDITLQALPIYRFIKDYVSHISVVNFKRGEYLFRGEDREKMIYYVLDGLVEVENVSYSGKN